MIYIVPLIILLLLSVRYDINGKTKYRKECYLVMLVVFILIAGLRWRLGVDTPNYLGDFYHKYPTLENFSFDDYGITKSPLYALLNSIVKTLGGRFYVVQLIHATIVNVLIFKYIKRHSTYIFMSVFFYALFAYTSYNMEIMRGSLSIVICLFANDYILEKKWIKGYALLVLALLFHLQTLLFLLLPFLFFLRLNKTGIIILIGAFLLGIVIMQLLGDYLWLFEGDETIEGKVSGYINSDRYGEQGGNIGFFVVSCFMPIFYIICSLLYAKKKRSDRKLLMLEPFLMLCIMFILIRMNVEIAYRYVDYFKVYYCMFYANLFVKFVIDEKILRRGLAYLRSFLIFCPFFYFIVVRSYILNKGLGYRYYPYTSVLDRTIDKKRQLNYDEIHSTKYPFPNINEY